MIDHICVIARMPGKYDQDARIYDADGVAPTVRSRDWKEPIKVLIKGGPAE